MELATLYKELRSKLAAGGVDNPPLEARRIITNVSAYTDADLIVRSDTVVSPDAAAQAARMVSRRLGGEPLSRIFGEREFWGLPFIVTPAVLDPRPDTETLIEAALGLFKACPPGRILDLGTGSGAIIVALLHEWPDAQGVATDLSADALAVAGRNAVQNGVSNRLMFRQGGWFEAIPVAERFDLIVSNPPYIPNPVIETLEPEVKNHDPILALDGGFDGLDSYKTILSGLERHFSDRGTALFEIGIGQGPEIARLAGNAGLHVIQCHPDLAGIPRVVQIGRGDK